MINTCRKFGGIVAGVALALLAGAATVPGQANATLWNHKFAFTNVNPNGLGGALIWPLFTVNNTDTLLAITNTTTNVSGDDSVVLTNSPSSTNLANINSPGRYVLVHFHVRKATDSADLKDWTVCLSPGDVWTAAFTASGANTVIDTGDASTTSISFPQTITGQTQGYIEAVAVDSGTSQAKGCDDARPNTGGTNGDVGFRMVNSLFGEEFFVSNGAGLASGANATAIFTFQDVRGFEPVVNTIKSTVAPDSTTKGANKRVWFALTHPGLGYTVGSLVSRWILDTATGLDTQMVVTFPVGNVQIKPDKDMEFGTYDTCSDCTPFNFNIPSKMAFWARDDEETLAAASPRQITLGNEVNVLTLSSLVAGNASLIPPGATGGWFRLMIDDDENEFVDAVLGKTCSVDEPGDTCSNGGGTLTKHYVPAMLPVVGFSILQGTQSGNLLSALLPWKSEAPLDLYNCAYDYCNGINGGLDMTP